MTDTPQDDESPQVEDQVEDQGQDAPPLDDMAAIQAAIQDAMDDGSMLAGYAIVAEWIEPEGQQSFSVLHSPMPPWHLHGLLTYARDSYLAHTGPPFVPEFDGDDFDDA